MRFHQLPVGRQQSRNRSGRGISAGRGKTAGRGTKGQGSRKSPTKLGFEGGQTPLSMRIPKLPGFRSLHAKAEVVSTSQLNVLKFQTIDTKALAEAAIISSPFVRAKLVFDTDLKSAKTVKLPGASAAAIKSIEKAGGKFELTPRQARPKSKSDTK